ILFGPGSAGIKAVPDSGRGSSEHDLAVSGMNREPADVIPLIIRSRRQLRPRSAAVSTLEHAGAANEISDVIDEIHAFARARVNHVWIARTHDHRGHAQVAHEIVEWRPGQAAVGSLPNASGDAANPHHSGTRGMDQNRSNSAADIARAKPRPTVGLYAGDVWIAISVVIDAPDCFLIPFSFRPRR